MWCEPCMGMRNLASPGIREGAFRLRGGGGGRDTIRTPNAWEVKIFSPLNDRWKRKLHSSADPMGACRRGSERWKSCSLLLHCWTPCPFPVENCSCDLIASLRFSLGSGGLFILPPRLRNVRLCERKCPVYSHVDTVANSSLMST